MNFKEYYQLNKEVIIKRIKATQKANNYAAEKTTKQRAIRNIKRKTRRYFSLLGHNCEFCSSKATEHHHFTNPIEFDKFNYVCHDCHNKLNAEMRNRRL
jgi:hypothetical protein